MALQEAQGVLAAGALNTSKVPQTIPEAINSPPFFYQNLHGSYVLSITTCFPHSSFLIATASTDGNVRLTDIRSPAIDSALAIRSRSYSTCLVFHALSQSVLASEDNAFLRAIALRRFFSTSTVGRLDPAHIVTLAVSPVHSSLLFGGSNGEVVAMNPLRRAVRPKGAVYWQQTWFKHDWVPAKTEQEAGGDKSGTGSTTAASAEAGPTAAAIPAIDPAITTGLGDGKGEFDKGLRPEIRQGISRFTEGYKLATGDLARMDNKVLWLTTYENEQSITSLAWNPNPLCAGWAAAGMGSGLVRVEDIAI